MWPAAGQGGPGLHGCGGDPGLLCCFQRPLVPGPAAPPAAAALAAALHPQPPPAAAAAILRPPPRLLSRCCPTQQPQDQFSGAAIGHRHGVVLGHPAARVRRMAGRLGRAAELRAAPPPAGQKGSWHARLRSRLRMPALWTQAGEHNVECWHVTSVMAPVRWTCAAACAGAIAPPDGLQALAARRPRPRPALLAACLLGPRARYLEAPLSRESSRPPVGARAAFKYRPGSAIAHRGVGKTGRGA